MNFVFEGKFLFVSFQFKDTIVKREYISSLFQISNTLIFVERECHLSISQMLCMISAAAPLQMSFVIQNWLAVPPKCELDFQWKYRKIELIPQLPQNEALRALVTKTLFSVRYINYMLLLNLSIHHQFCPSLS